MITNEIFVLRPAGVVILLFSVAFVAMGRHVVDVGADGAVPFRE
ncbi:hypothetical protein [Streptomyces sp. NPDC004629]